MLYSKPTENDNGVAYGFDRQKILAWVSMLIAVLMLSSFAIAENIDSAEGAESFRSYLQQQYGITILMGDECREYSVENYEIVIGADGYERFKDFLRLMDGILSEYPPFFFNQFRWTISYGGIKFLVVDDILLDGKPVGGVMHGADSDGKIIMFLSSTSAKERAVHHEIGHAIEYRIIWEFPDAFADWTSLNPEGFEYKNDLAIVTDKTKAEAQLDDWFVRGYSEIDESEDRATVFETIMTKDREWWSSRPHLQKKAQAFRDKAILVFKEMPAGEW